jgi:hypothetical protein
VALVFPGSRQHFQLPAIPGRHLLQCLRQLRRNPGRLQCHCMRYALSSWFHQCIPVAFGYCFCFRRYAFCYSRIQLPVVQCIGRRYCGGNGCFFCCSNTRRLLCDRNRFQRMRRQLSGNYGNSHKRIAEWFPLSDFPQSQSRIIPCYCNKFRIILRTPHI